MKKVLSVFLAAVMLVGTLSLGVVATSDTCIRLTDTSGSTGYSAGSDAVNEWVVENDGGTLIFDVKLESVATPGSGKVSRLVAFTGDAPYNYAGYDFTNGQFIAGAGDNWPTDTQTTTYTAYSTKSFEWETGVWYEIAYQFNGNEATVYLDGIPMVSAEIDTAFITDYMILYPQYCTVLIDNLRVCGKDYNVRDRYGDVYAATDFTGVTSVGSVSCWAFSGTGYSVSTDGRAMPELGEMLPQRTVAPAIDGAYLKYSEAGGNGTGTSVISFNDYNGFTYVEDVRVDRKSSAASMGVRFGGNYIAGYDWDTATFRISGKTGYGFNTTDTYTYAKTEYALSMKTVYELAVRQNGNVVSVYLDGVLMVQAASDDFVTTSAKIEVSHYRMGASIDNAVIAYPDYDVREAKGSAAARFTFDEDASYIDGIWDFNLDTGSTGYTIAKETGAAAVTVADAEAADGKATVGITLENCTDFTAFALDIAYNSQLSVSQVTPQSILDGTSVVSPTANNPVTVSYVAPVDGNVPDGKIINVVFNTPTAYGDYDVTVTLTPYINDVPGASFSGTGSVTVPEPGMNTGLPNGLAYDGETLSWIAPENALAYEIYMLYEGDDYEMYVDYTEESEYYFPYADYIPDPGLYIFRIYMYDDTYELASVSDDFGVIVEADGNIVTGGLEAYAEVLLGRLNDSVAENTYTDDNQALIDGYLADAQYDIAAATDYATMVDTYEGYKAMIEEIPVKEEETVLAGDVDGNGAVDQTDNSILARFLKGADITVTVGADVDGDGDINTTDRALLKRMLK